MPNLECLKFKMIGTEKASMVRKAIELRNKGIKAKVVMSKRGKRYLYSIYTGVENEISQAKL